MSCFIANVSFSKTRSTIGSSSLHVLRCTVASQCTMPCKWPSQLCWDRLQMLLCRTTLHRQHQFALPIAHCHLLLTAANHQLQYSSILREGLMNYEGCVRFGKGMLKILRRFRYAMTYNRILELSLIDLSPKYCTVSWPLSVFPTWTVTLRNINMSTNSSSERTSSSLRLYNSLGGRVYGTVYEGLWLTGDERLWCAKIIETDYQVFENEVDIYQHLRRSTFTLPLYAAFSGTHHSRRFGIFIMDILDRTFKSYNDMTNQEKYAVMIQCH